MIRITLWLLWMVPLTVAAQHQHHHPPPSSTEPVSSENPSPSIAPLRCEGGYCHDMKEHALLMGQLSTASWSDDGRYQTSVEGYFWYGTSLRRLWVRAEMENIVDGYPWPTTELVYSHAIRAYWDVQVGLKMAVHDEERELLAGVGISGLAPYWFDVHGGIWMGRDGHVIGSMEAAYEYPLTQWIHLVPKIKTEIDNEGHPSVASGVSTWALSVRPSVGLYWEIRREFALGLVYAGPTWSPDISEKARLQFSVRAWY